MNKRIRLSYVIMMFFAYNSCIQSADTKVDKNAIVGKYVNSYDYSILKIGSDSSYERIDKFKNKTMGKWYFIAPREIGFRNWTNTNREVIDLNVGILRKGKIIFNLDNNLDNYYKLEE